MPRQKIGSEKIRKLQKSSSGSYYLTLPMESIRDLGWRDNQKLVVKKWGKRLSIGDWEG